MNVNTVIKSPLNSQIESVYVKQGDFVYEWETLVLINTKNGLEEIRLGVSGFIEELQVEVGTNVKKGETLVTPREDHSPLASD